MDPETDGDKYPVTAYRSTGVSNPDTGDRVPGTWLWDADDGVEDGLYRLYIQIQPPAWDPDMYRIDVSVYTDQSGPNGRPDDHIFEFNPDTGDVSSSLEPQDLVMTVKGLQPRADGLVEVGLVDVKGQQIAVTITNKGDLSVPHYFYGIVLTPRRHDWGKVNINTAWDAPATNFKTSKTDFYNTLAAAPVFRQTFNGRTLDAFAPSEPPAPANFGPGVNTLLRRFIDRIQQARQYANPNPDLATPFKTLGDLLNRRVNGNQRILTEITDTAAAVSPELAFQQRREIVERFKRLSNLFTTQSNVFEIICTAQSGFVTDEPKEEQSLRGSGARVTGTYGFQTRSERKIRVIYER
ncbi:MAG: hypothetical protein J7M12_04090 [Candidatus Hydrogenedentes bacterium]|nr:hypothetical protein [Candidatus Hydrogenedentota bacterium]